MCAVIRFFIQNGPTIIQAIFIIFGWVIVHKLSSKRDIEKTRRDIVSSSVDKLIESVNSIVDTAYKYHITDRDSSLENKIKRELSDLSIRASSLKDLTGEIQCKPLWEQIRRFRQAITGEHFEDEHIGRLQSSDQQFELIAEYEISLKRVLFDLKHLQFKLD